MTPMEIAALTNAAIDILATLKQNGVEVTPDNIDQRIAERQAEVDELDRKVNES
jgi:hypothetical protein